MEDHLRNKGRLQREWDVLCRYEAEPSAREAALQVQCAQLNRPDAPLPYDHSRVVLNHLANAEGLDYINASTIVSRQISICKPDSGMHFMNLISIHRPTMTLEHPHMLPPKVHYHRPLLTSGK